MGRWLIVILLVSGAIAGVGFNYFLKRSPEVRFMVRDHLKSDFMTYAIKTFNRTELSVDSIDGEPGYPQAYIFKLQEPWSLELHDQTVAVVLPHPQALALPERVHKEISSIFLKWLDERYPRDKKLRLEVKFEEIPSGAL